MDAVALRQLIADGQVSAADVDTVAREAIMGVADDLGALAQPLFETSLVADEDGPFGGVPFVIKDSGPFARGVSFAYGSRAIRGVADEDHELMRRFRRAGLMAVGQTCAPELSLNFATESRLHGVTRNPWNLERGTGGSSGGAAALVAAGAVPVAHGSDGAGSIRIPAACCGVVGLKPSRGRTTSGPDVFGGMPMGVDFALTRTVRDTAALLDAVAAPSGLPRPVRPYGELAQIDPGRLRIGFTTLAGSTVDVDEEVAAVARGAAEMLDWIGHDVSEVATGFDQRDVVDALLLAIHAAGKALLLAPRRPDTRLLEAVSRSIVSETASMTDADLDSWVRAQRRVTGSVEDVFDRIDVLVTPVTAELPLAHRTLDYDDPRWTARTWLERILEFGPFTAASNVSGHPAISLPLGQSRSGMPIGVQLVAGMGREDSLLQVAAQLEQAMPWADREPPIFAG
ncbi:amidase [Diaminobutyricibacter tongyongensis]|uniref:amidase n=1 Tax=Leifsonia tongyongensis TaxID=1268043 RepID=UPI001962FB90|nr:amidase family protein [Diaminobutyricibacter tongyongensis]